MGLTFLITVNQRPAAYDIKHAKAGLQQNVQVYFIAISRKQEYLPYILIITTQNVVRKGNAMCRVCHSVRMCSLPVLPTTGHMGSR